MATASGHNLTNGLEISKPLKTFKGSELNLPKVEEIEGITDYKQITSYNWFGKPENPIIIVPGEPKQLVEWRGGQLKSDPSILRTDENHFMLPSFPMEPLFQAVKICQENEEGIKFQNFDVVTDKNNLRRLFDVLGSSIRAHSKAGLRKFRVDMQRIGNMVCLIHCQDMDLEQVFDKRRPTYGRDFETKCSKPTNDIFQRSFHQIVSYKLGSLKFIVRCEVDCADYDRSRTNNDAVGMMATLTVNELTNPESLPGSELCVIKRGSRRDYHLVELATRVYFNQFPCHTWPQMFFSGTETLVIGWQKYGKVEPNGWIQHGKTVRRYGVEKFSVEEVLREFGGYPEATLTRLYNFLSKLLEFMRLESDEKMFSVYWEPEFNDEIKIFEVIDVERSVIPEGLKRFVSQN